MSKRGIIARSFKKNSSQAVIASCFLLMTILCMTNYVIKTKNNTVTYTENSDASYRVYIDKDNNYYENDYIDMNNRYIASLIKNISARLTYNLKLNKNTSNYEYSYKIIADVKVVDKQDRDIIFTKQDELFSSQTLQSGNEINIEKDIVIDYNKYNDSISKFVKLYELDETNCAVNVIMYVTAKNSNGEIINNNKVVELSIPLTTKTIAIQVNKNIKSNEINNLLIAKNTGYVGLLYAGIITFLIFLLYAIGFYIIIQREKSPEYIYRDRLNKILRKFGSSIQVAKENSLNIAPQQVIRIENFEDMLEISEIEQKALILTENKEKTGAFFIILLDENRMFAYHFSVNDIIAEMNGKKIVKKNVDNIEKMKSSTKTKERVQRKLEETRTMEVIDPNNVIRGTKNSKESIYEQLGKTQSFKLSDLKEAEEKSKKQKSTIIKTPKKTVNKSISKVDKTPKAKTLKITKKITPKKTEVKKNTTKKDNLKTVQKKVVTKTTTTKRNKK